MYKSINNIRANHLRFTLFLLFLCGTVVASPSSALTCRYPGIDRMIRDAQVIFEGKAVAHKKSSTIFSVSEFYKGSPTKKIMLLGAYKIGDKYLIYAWLDKEGQLYTPECIFNTNIDSLKVKSDSVSYNKFVLKKFYEAQAKLKLYRDVYGVGLWERLQENPKKWAMVTIDWYMEWGDYQKALDVYKKYPEYVPNLNPPEKGRLNRNQDLNVGRYVFVLAKNGLYGKAGEIIKRFYDANPDNTIIQQHYSWLLFELSRESELPRGDFSYAGIDFHYTFINFSKQTLKFIEFLGSDLSGLNLSGAKIGKVNISSSPVSRGNFMGTMVDYMEYESVLDVSSDYSDSLIGEFDIGDSTFDYVSFKNAEIKMDASWSVIANADMQGANLDGSKFRGVRFSNSNLSGVSFKSADLSGIYTFDEDGVDFSEVIYDEATVWPSEMDMQSMLLRPSISKYIQDKDREDEARERQKMIYPGQYWR